MILSKEAILAADDLQRETVAVPEWGGNVCVRTLSGEERARMVDGFVRASKENPDEPFNVHLAAAAMCDEAGQQLFLALADVRALAAKNGTALERVYLAARRLNGYDREALKKSSMPTPS